MRRLVLAATVLGLAIGIAAQADPAANVTHSELQAVNAAGEQTYNLTDKVILEGILLNNPGDMLDPTPDQTIDQPFDIFSPYALPKSLSCKAAQLGKLFEVVPGKVLPVVHGREVKGRDPVPYLFGKRLVFLRVDLLFEELRKPVRRGLRIAIAYQFEVDIFCVQPAS